MNGFPFSGTAYEFEVTGASDDIKAPILISISVDHDEVVFNQLLTFTAIVEEESELALFRVTMNNGDKEITLCFTRKIGKEYTAKYYIDATLPKGQYRVNSIEMWDELNNCTYYGNYDGCIFTNNFSISERPLVNFAGGDGTPNNPYLIKTKEQLNEVRYHIDKNFKLMADITFMKDGFKTNGLFYNSGLGWIPICYSDSISIQLSTLELMGDIGFKGCFDGNGYKISGLNVTEDFNFCGLFGITNNAVVKNVSLVNSSVSAKTYAGGIAGHAFGSQFINCVNSSVITGGYDTGGIVGYGFNCNFIGCQNKEKIISKYKNEELYELGGSGGIVGYCEYNTIIKGCMNKGKISGNCAGGILGKKLCEGVSGSGIIENCENMGEVEGYSCTGGIAGMLDDQNYMETELRSCYNSGSLSTDGQYIGGIIGRNYDYSISNCYNKGELLSTEVGSYVGGIVGYAGSPFSNFKYIGNVNNCYNAGSIISNGMIGGIVGYQKEGETSDCYYLNTTVKGIGNDVSADNVISCTATEMKEKSIFKTFDFDNIWKFIQGYEYPVLSWQQDAGNPENPTLPGGLIAGGGPVPIVQMPSVNADQGAKVALSSDGTKAMVTVLEGYELVDITVNGVSKGKVLEISGLKPDDKMVVITKAIRTEPAIETVEAEMAAINADNFFARSKIVTLKSGKKAIKVTWSTNSDMKFDGVEIFRSTKRYKGYGKKPVHVTTKDAYYNTAVKKGKTYYYKIRGYVNIEGEKVYTGWSSKAWRVMK
ncbi:MAG: hypothetical protein HFE73_10260 [Firmicutes bacterium]|nr:hypothetical protein [Bacillota bacterium]